MRDYILNVISPKIQGDGGWVEFSSFDGETLELIFKGECSKCLILERCVAWIKSEIKKDRGIDVKIKAVRKKPYFWDK
jgi:Fe-S cluster biogenesis protein NfuA